MIRKLKRQFARLTRPRYHRTSLYPPSHRFMKASHPLSSRTGFIEALDLSESFLEIGPYFNPTITGPNVRYFDVFDRQTLIARARRDPHIDCGPEAIPEIHFHSPTGELSVVDEIFDSAFSSHCIEHQPDLIRHLNDVHDVLRPGGRYHVICPDQRYCFDYFRPLSTIGNVLDAHAEKRVFHSRSNYIDHTALTTHNIARRHWAGDHADSQQAHSLAERVMQAGRDYDENAQTYLDAHAWIFRPETFLQVTETLFELRMIRLRPVNVWDTPDNQHEFTAILERPSDTA